ncbi:MFS transporter [Mucilaginibacter terrae]|uniref:Lysosomal dipeptide transporter MFSD1 n=1 Tax=Mucilaginibacter terrae TaxID=1955052 RepID=A0ABU3GTZ6_9SPHI|nr:MFS transporter [Mucilaginibacter terrae]MDT3403242.1 MFS family permease [Mucilaginibacter terrae]
MQSNTPLQQTPQSNINVYSIAWVIGLLFYFVEYAVRSSPSVMIPELSAFFNLSTVKIGSLIGTYYYTYSITSLIAGIALDKAGAKYTVSVGIAILGLGCMLFALSNVFTGNVARMLQGAGSAFAFPACVYLAAKGFSSKSLATAIGFTQCLGMLGGTAGQSLVGPLIAGGLSLPVYWFSVGAISLVLCVAIYLITPLEKPVAGDAPIQKSNWIQPYKIVFGNVQSYLCGLVSGLLFAPTTVFIMIWGILFFQHDRSFSFEQATHISSMVPLGWVVGCPLLGWLTDVLGKRKPVIISGCMVMILSIAQLLYLPAMVNAQVSMFMMGVGSGAAMIPYSIIKEVNPDNVKGSATGAINFITFGVISLLGPLFGSLFGKTLTTTNNHTAHFQSAGLFLIGGILLALIISLFLKETGRKSKLAAPVVSVL